MRRLLFTTAALVALTPVAFADTAIHAGRLIDGTGGAATGAGGVKSSGAH
jgi:hypothetical protein